MSGSNWEPSLHYQQLQLMCAEQPDLVLVLTEHYSLLSMDFLTREVRYILERCLTTEWVEFVTNTVDFSDASTTAMLLAAGDVAGKVADLLDRFKAELKHFFQTESRALSTCEAGPCEIRLMEIEDRFVRLVGKFERHYKSDGGFCFLRMIRSALDLEARLVRQPEAEIARGCRKRLHESASTLSVCSNGLLAEKLARKCAKLGEREPSSARLNETLGRLKAMCISQERASGLIDLVSDVCDNWLSSMQSVSTVGDSLACRDLKQLDESSAEVFANVLKTCKFFGLLDRLNAQMHRLRLRSLVMTHQSDQVIRAGSTCAGKYVELKLRLLFAEFFAKFYGEERITPELCVALLTASETETFGNGEMSLETLTGITAATSGLLEHSTCNWSDSKSDPEDSGCARLKFRFKSRPPCEKSSKVSRAAQPFALCVFFPIADGKFVACLSKPVVFITNANQLVAASAASHYYASRCPVYPLRRGPPAPLTIDDVISLIDKCAVEETSRPLNQESLQFFRDCLAELAAGYDSLISFDYIVTKPLLPNKQSVWEFLQNCLKFIRDHGSAMFRDGLVFGFVTRERATKILTDRMLHGDLCASQQLGLLRFSQTTATVTVALGDKHEAPKDEAYIKSVSLAEFCYSALPLPARLICADGRLVSAERLQAYVPKEKFIPGYVSLNRELSLCSAGDILDIDLDDLDL